MINTERISAWLEMPHHLQEIAPEAIQHLANEYPFFTPAHYFLWINGSLSKDAMAQVQQSNPVNPVMLGNLIQAANKPQTEFEIVIEETTRVTSSAITEEEKTEEIEEKFFPVNEQGERLAVFQTEEATDASKENAAQKEPEITEEDLAFIQPASSEDYFLQQGIKVSNDIPDFAEGHVEETDEEKALMVVMSFAEWLKHISSKSKKAKEEQDDQRALKTMWQQQKLAAAIEEESDEIPEQVFEMAVNSIARKEELVSESLANVYAKQGKYEKAIEMYQKLSLQNPEKNAYFAAKIENLQKEI